MSTQAAQLCAARAVALRPRCCSAGSGAAVVDAHGAWASWLCLSEKVIEAGRLAEHGGGKAWAAITMAVMARRRIWRCGLRSIALAGCRRTAPCARPARRISGLSRRRTLRWTLAVIVSLLRVGCRSIDEDAGGRVAPHTALKAFWRNHAASKSTRFVAVRSWWIRIKGVCSAGTFALPAGWISVRFCRPHRPGFPTTGPAGEQRRTLGFRAFSGLRSRLISERSSALRENLPLRNKSAGHAATCAFGSQFISDARSRPAATAVSLWSPEVLAVFAAGCRVAF